MNDYVMCEANVKLELEIHCYICNFEFRSMTHKRIHMKVKHSEMLVIVVYGT